MNKRELNLSDYSTDFLFWSWTKRILILSIVEADVSAKMVLKRGLSQGTVFTRIAHVKTEPNTDRLAK
jgi:hypothetical protein